MVLVLHRELEYKVEKLKYNKLEVMWPEFQLVNKPSRISPHKVLKL